MRITESENPQGLHPSLIGPRRPEIPPPPKLSPEEIERVEEWLRKNVAPPTHGPFRW